MEMKTQEVLVEAMNITPDELQEAEDATLEYEAGMCESCTDAMVRGMASIQQVVNDDSISYATRLAHCMTTCAIMLSESSHGKVSVSEVYGSMYANSREIEAIHAAEFLLKRLFGMDDQHNN